MAASVWAGNAVFGAMERLRGMEDAEYLQYLVAYHAAPTVQGIKPATLLCPGGGGREIGKAYAACCRRVADVLGVEMADLRNCSGALLLLVYNPCLLRAALGAEEVMRVLAEAGYDAPTGRVEALVERLREKCGRPVFPHEIGLFLGYPARDVRRFIADGGAGCVASGCWKVYGEAGAAERCFARYRGAKQLAARLIADGADLRQVAAGLRRGA